MTEIIHIFHNVYEQDEKWCVEYTVVATEERKTDCFDNNTDAVAFYMS